MHVLVCDLGGHAALERLYAAARPTALFHLAGVPGDGTVSLLGADEVAAAFQAKVEGAWHLHRLGRDLECFVLYSSLSGLLGAPGQGAYAAANCFLDALAAERRASGVYGLSLAWGLWQPQGLGMTRRVGEAELRRMEEEGVAAFTPEEGLALLDAALVRPEALLVGVKYARPLHDGWIRASWTRRDAPQPTAARVRVPDALEVRRLAAEILGLPGAESVPADAPLTELGLDSLMSIELRNRLEAAFAVRLTPGAVLAAPRPDALAELLRAARAPLRPTPLAQPAPEPASRPGALPILAPLTANQARLLFLDRVLARRETYNLCLAMRVEAALDLPTLRRALEVLVARHDQLRLHFVEGPDGPCQRILPWAEVPIERIDLRSLPPEAREPAFLKRAQEQAATPIDLGSAPLIRGVVAALGEQATGIAFAWHHIATDGWSASVFLRQLSEVYLGLRRGEPPRLDPAPGYAELLENDRLDDGQLREHQAWWRAHLAGVEPLALPLDRPRGVGSERGGTTQLRLDAALSEGVDGLARALGATPFAVLLTGLAVVLSRACAQPRVPVGVVTSGRTRASAEAAIGFFVRTLPLCCDLGGDPSVEQAILRTRDRVLEGIDHQHLPLTQILAAAQGADRGRAEETPPLLRVCFVLDERSWLRPSFARAPCVGVGGGIGGDVEGTARFDLSMVMVRQPEGYTANLTWRADLFEAETIARLLAQLERALSGLVEDPKRRLSTLPLLRAAEREQLLVTWNQTAVPVPELPVQALFEQQVSRRPESPALHLEGETLSYGALNARANRLAWRLRSLGVGPEVRVGVGLERSLELVVAVLGVLKAGGAYVPLDPSYPEARLRLLAEDAGLSVLIGQSGLALPAPARVPRLDLDRLDLSAEPDENPPLAATSANLIYVMYTSGSTGRPKGVAVTHQSVVRLVRGARYAELDAEQVFLQSSPFSFDLRLELGGAPDRGLGFLPSSLVADFIARDARDAGVDGAVFDLLPPTLSAEAEAAILRRLTGRGRSVPAAEWRSLARGYLRATRGGAGRFDLLLSMLSQRDTAAEAPPEDLRGEPPRARAAALGLSWPDDPTPWVEATLRFLQRCAAAGGPAAWDRRRLPVTGEELRALLVELEAAHAAFGPPSLSIQATDVWIATYPKCGTTWIQQIVHGLRSRGAMDFPEISYVVPFVERAAQLGVDLNAPQVAAPRAFKTHLPWSQLPRRPAALLRGHAARPGGRRASHRGVHRDRG